VRASDHSKELRLYEIHSRGITIGPALPPYHHGLLTADPRTTGERRTP
jgi:hypothetical protein